MRQYDLSPPPRARRQGPWPGWLFAGLIALLSLPALWPFWVEGLPRSFDGGLHLLRIALLDRHIMAGDLFPRWVSEQILGFGYPLFSFYAPSSYYLVEALHLLGLSFYYAFIAAFALAVMAAGVGMAWLARDLFGPSRPWAALVAAIAYVYAPYLLTNVYIRGALAEACAQALLPWILWSARRLLRDGPRKPPARYVLPLALTLGGLAITHNITLLFTPPLLLAYGALHWVQTGRARRAFLWFSGALVAAMGISAFFWLPLLVERTYLADTAYDIAKNVWLPGSVWRWDNFLDTGFYYQHTFARPIRLGLVQLLLAVAGFALVRRWTAEWIFFGVVALVSGALIGAWSLPLWLSNDILPVAQFTWRLLSICSLPPALFVGGIVSRLPQGAHASNRWARVATGVVSVALIVLMIAAQRPQLGWMGVFAADTVDLSAPVFAQVEVDKGVLGGGEGNSSIQEFRPRWVARTLALEPATVGVNRGSIADVVLHTTGPRRLHATLTATPPTPDGQAILRFGQFYYPGWRVTLDDTTELAPFPTTNLGLLTVNIPAGRHAVELEWVGTSLQRWAGWGSLLALVGVIVLGFFTHRRALAVLCCVALAYGLAATLVTPPPQPITPPSQPLAAAGINLVGYRIASVSGNRYAIHPTWQVSATPPDDLRLGWRIVNGTGEVIAETVTAETITAETGIPETVAAPYFNTSPADLWPPNTLINDAYLLPVPPGLPLDTYQIEARIIASSGEAAGGTTDFVPVGDFTPVAPIPPQPTPAQFSNVRFGDVADLVGYATVPATYAVMGTERPPLLVLNAGEYLRYKLLWQARRPLFTNYHAFVHLVDLAGQPLVQEDQLPGPFFQPPRLWDTTRMQPDVYLLRLPATAPSALYWPAVGLYDFDTLERLPAYVGEGENGADGSAALDAARLPPLKVVNRRMPALDVESQVEIDDFATLRGYDLALPEGGLQPGASFSVTLYYAAQQPAQVDYVRFLQLYAPEQGVIAQQDAPPRGGGNPTWSWQPGEVIADPVVLTVDEQAAPGRYTLYMGFYDAGDVARRAPLYDAEDNPLADQWAPLVELVVASPAP